jgi:hypothetical protein
MLMLVLRRTDGQWVEITHRSGDVMRFRVYDLHRQPPGQVHLAFDDPHRHFTIQRPERLARQAATPPVGGSTVV